MELHRPKPDQIVAVGYKNLREGSRLKLLDFGQADEFSVKNSNIQFNMGVPQERTQLWTARLKNLGVNFLEFHVADMRSMKQVIPDIQYGLSILGAKVVSLDVSCSNEQVEYIFLDDNQLDFSFDQFPAARFLFAKYDPRGRLAEFARSSPLLESLSIRYLDSVADDIFGRLREVTLSSPKCAELPFNFQNGSLQLLWLHNMRQLRNISGISRLACLERVKLYYCPKIETLEALLEVHSIKSVDVIGCRFQDKSVFDELRKRGVEVSGLT